MTRPESADLAAGSLGLRTAPLSAYAGVPPIWLRPPRPWPGGGVKPVMMSSSGKGRAWWRGPEGSQPPREAALAGRPAAQGRG